MITVCLHGSLREYGRRFDLHVETPAEALRALFLQFDGLRNQMRSGFFQVRFNGQDQSEAGIAEAFARPAAGILHLVPRVAGASRPGWQIVAGVVLMAVGYFTFGATSAWGAAMISAGMGMSIGGVAQLLTKPPKLDMEQRGQKAGRNTAFSNLDNTAAQGQPVPLAYGLVYCGSRVVSQGVESRRVDTTGDVVMQDPTAENITLNIKKTFISGVAARAPNGQPYATDFNHDSVRARNYTATIEKA